MSLSANEVDGKIYLIGGQTGGPSSIVGLNEVYDVANDSWTIKEPLPYPVDSYASAIVDDKIYVIGGFEGLHHGVPVGYTQIYDPVTDSWSFGASLPEIVRSGAAGATSGMLAPKRIYVIGGMSDTRGVNSTQIYDPENDAWTFGAQMPTARYGLAVVVNDLLYALGGSPYLTAPSMTANEQYVPFGYSAPVSEVPQVTGSEPTANIGIQLKPINSFLIVFLIIAVIVVSVLAAVLYYRKKT
jgi:hypothetical protein